MAEFKNGIFTAPALRVAPCGLLSVVDLDTPQDERWLRKFSTETNASPTINILSHTNATVTDGEIADGREAPRDYETFPFYVEVVVRNTGQRLLSNNPLATPDLLAQAEGALQKVLEVELWEGHAAQADSDDPSLYLTKENGAEIVGSGTGSDPARALALIEGSIASSPVGERGVIHMTRDVASSLGSRLLYKSNAQIDDNAYAVTRLGTLVVIGSGYTGAGPDGATGAAPSETNKWMFATGGLEVRVGEASVANGSLADGFDTDTNDSIVSVVRPAAVHFDPSIWSAVRVTLA